MTVKEVTSNPENLDKSILETTSGDSVTWLYVLFQSSLAQWFWTLSFIMGGCCSNAFALEILVTDAPKSGNLITFAQFVLVASEGLWVNLEFNGSFFPKLKKRNIPLTRWILMVVLFCSSSQINNFAFAFKIPMALHIIFRSGSLITNMLMGVALLGKRYKLAQVVSIICVTVGIIITTFSTIGNKPDSASTSDSTASQQLIGVAILTLALCLASFLGIVQEVTYAKYGKHWREGLFYTHFLSLPVFLFFSNDIAQQVKLYSSSPNIAMTGYMGQFLDYIGLPEVPKLCFYLFLNIGTQYFCVSGVQRLSSMSTALTLNLVLTIRKMVSILFSVIYFQQPISSQFILGTVMAFGGTFIYSMASINPSSKPSGTNKVLAEVEGEKNIKAN